MKPPKKRQSPKNILPLAVTTKTTTISTTRTTPHHKHKFQPLAPKKKPKKGGHLGGAQAQGGASKKYVGGWCVWYIGL
jgi:hypothetical protein